MIEASYTKFRTLPNSGDLVYGGYSAGACVAGATLRGLELVDNPNDPPASYSDYRIHWEGLGLVDYSIAPHYKSAHPESAAIEGVVEYFRVHHLPYRALQDGEVIVVDE